VSRITKLRLGGADPWKELATEGGGVDVTFANFLARDRRPGEKPPPRAPEPLPAPPAPQPAEPRGLTAFLDAGAEFSGVLRTAGTVRIGGQFDGRIESEDYVILSSSARVHADIDAEAAVISGEVRGNVTARRKITLDATARVTGDLTTPGIVIEEGARLKGRITIGGEDDAAEGVKDAEKEAASPAAAPTLRPPRRPDRPAHETTV
jgi:cytoskeletal protein CcmA (bactofilin family)